jgi:hypothetical protein
MTAKSTDKIPVNQRISVLRMPYSGGYLRERVVVRELLSPRSSDLRYGG